MTDHDKELSLIIGAIKISRSFFIAGHIKPDGDTIGASIALASLLSRLDKNAEVYSKDEVPYYLKFLKGSSMIKSGEKPHKTFDSAIILECSSLERMGYLIRADQAKMLINIDHHRVFEVFGDINYIDPGASSTSEQVYRLFKKMNMKFTESEAEAIYTGAVSDTGRFQYSNTTPFCLSMAADLVSCGVRPEKIFSNLYEKNKLSSLKLLGEALSTLKVSASGKIAYIEIPNSMFKKSGADYSETENIINYAVSVEGVKVALLFRESEQKGVIKVSLRSRGTIDVSKVAKHFDGGGHRNAAGLTISGTIQSAEKKLLTYVAGLTK
jgi:phosphoesterase RecJ-like protein